MQCIVDRNETTAGYAPVFLSERQTPAAPGWHPLDAPGLVAPSAALDNLRLPTSAVGIADWQSHRIAALQWQWRDCYSEKMPADVCSLD